MNTEKTTKELLDLYFETIPETTAIKVKGQIDRPELYEYERTSGRKLEEFDAMDLIEFLKTINNSSFKDRQYKISYRSYDMILSLLRGFYDWYIDNVKIIKNPCNDKRIKGTAGMKLLSDDREVFSTETMENIIDQVRNNAPDEKNADYYESIIRLFYEGFPEAIDIVKLQTKDVDDEKKTATVRGKTLQLSDRLSALLKTVHDMDEFPAYRGHYVMVAFEDSYFRFPTREKNKDEIRTAEFYANYISRVFNQEIKQKLHLNINARTLYLCGFYDYMVKTIGKEHTKEILESLRNTEMTKELMTLAESYGVVEKNPTILKKLLLPFVL